MYMMNTKKILKIFPTHINRPPKQNKSWKDLFWLNNHQIPPYATSKQNLPLNFLDTFHCKIFQKNNSHTQQWHNFHVQWLKERCSLAGNFVIRKFTFLNFTSHTKNFFNLASCCDVMQMHYNSITWCIQASLSN